MAEPRETPETRRNPIVIQASEDWSYHIDATTAPAYVLVTQRGAANGAVFVQTLTDLIRVMDEVMGPGERFCPFIVDLRHAVPGRITIPSGQNAMRSIQPRIQHAVLIVNPQETDILVLFLSLLSKIMPDLDVVYSMEDALAKLGLQSTEG